MTQDTTVVNFVVRIYSKFTANFFNDFNRFINRRILNDAFVSIYNFMGARFIESSD